MVYKDAPQQFNGHFAVGSGERIGIFGWMILYISGGILVILLLAHIFHIHFISTETLNSVKVRADVDSFTLSFINIALLVVGLIHGLLGFRRVILDLDLFRKKRRPVVEMDHLIDGVWFVLVWDNSF